MNATLLVFGCFVFLAIFNAGTMTALQLQHYAIYRFVGRESFKDYIQANNKAAAIPAVLPAMILLLMSIVLVFIHPPFMTLVQSLAALALNVVSLASTFKWQRKLQSEMATTGYDEAKVALLNSTNWIRTVAFLAQALLATAIVISALAHATSA